MLEAFERHLNNNLFQKRIEKAKTLNEQIQFCKDFLKEHGQEFETVKVKYVPSPSPLVDDTVYVRTVYPKDYKVFHAKKMVKDGYAKMTDVEVARYIYRPLGELLMAQIIEEGLYKIEEHKDLDLDQTVYTAKIGVFKP